MMQTYASEAVPREWPHLVEMVTNGQEIIIMGKDHPIMRLVPMMTAEEYRRRIRALYGIAPGLDPYIERDEDRV